MKKRNNDSVVRKNRERDSVPHIRLADEACIQVVPGGDRSELPENADGMPVETFDYIVAQAQSYFASFVPAGVSLVEEVLAERRAEAQAEIATREGFDSD